MILLAHKVGMIGLGCAKNQGDAEIMLSELTKAGFEITPNADEPDAVIVNTCGFIEDAKRESIEEILGMGLRKQQGKLKAVIVTGCLAER
jgi:ribosomal protein S12 methylthiotransferase